jgi:hypothetical protein
LFYTLTQIFQSDKLNWLKLQVCQWKMKQETS